MTPEPARAFKRACGCRRRECVRLRRQRDREGRANVETRNSVVIFPGIGKHACKQHNDDGNRLPLRRGVYEGEIRGVVYAKPLREPACRRRRRRIFESSTCVCERSTKQYLKILAKGRWRQSKMNDHRIRRKRRQHRGQHHTHGVPLARRGLDSLGDSANSHFGYLFSRWRGGSSRHRIGSFHWISFG